MSSCTYYEIKLNILEDKLLNDNFIEFISKLCLLDIHKDNDITRNLTNLYTIYQFLIDCKEAINGDNGSIVDIPRDEFIEIRKNSLLELKEIGIKLFVIRNRDINDRILEYFKLFINSIDYTCKIYTKTITEADITDYYNNLFDWYNKHKFTYNDLVDGTDMSLYKRLINIYTKNNEIQTDEKSIKETNNTDIAFNFIHADEMRRIQQYNYNTDEYIINSILSTIQSGILINSINSNTRVGSYYYNFEYKDNIDISDIGLDIGPKTVELFNEYVEKSKTII